MTAESFRMRRRQRFLTGAYFELNLEFLRMLVDASMASIDERAGSQDHQAASEGSLFQDKLNLLRLYYTAGRSIEELQPLYTEAIRALSDWHSAYRAYVKHLALQSGEDLLEDGSPIHLEDLFHYQLAIDVVSLGVLLGDGNAVRQIAVLMGQRRGTDLLFESLIAPAVPDTRDNTDFFHLEPYDPLIDAFYTAETPGEASAKVKQYLEGWYKSFDGVPWHDGHLHATHEYMPYYGYWSFEAAAVCVIHGIDDRSFRDHLVYPKDLADWARTHSSVSRLKTGDSPVGLEERLRCRASDPCPRNGWWSTPASQSSRRQFRAGEVMPSFSSDYGNTIWQWDEQQ